jgi:hypothetical protein
VDDLFPLLMILIFVLGPIIEGLKRKNRQPPPPPPQRRVPPPSSPPQRSRTEELNRGSRTEENASTMVPDDLWEILTGQKRMPAPTAPPPTPQSERRSGWDIGYDAELEEDEELEEERVVFEDVNVETRRSRVEAQSLETIGRHPEPVVISLEENIPSTAQRHADFHQRINAAPPVVEVAPRRKPLFDLHNRSELQRAFLLQEVFGKPKGLEDLD